MPDMDAGRCCDIDESRIGEKFAQIGLVFELLKTKVWGQNGIDGLFLNPSIARGVAVSYLHDIDRMKDYHRFELIDEAKQACYWIKWIIREKPVQFDLAVAGVKSDHRLANEEMAVVMACACLQVSPTLISKSFIRLLMYTFHFRRVDEDSLLPLCDLLWRLSKSHRAGDIVIKTPL